MSSYYTVLGYDKDDDSYTHFSDFSVFSRAEAYAMYLVHRLKPKCSDGDEYDWFEVWDSNKNRVAVASVSGFRKEAISNENRTGCV